MDTNEIYQKVKKVFVVEFEIDEENPADNGKHVRKNTISAKLKKKINSYGVKMSEIKRIFGDEYV